jgi:Uncharacterized proteins involved in stress response, homologs of TerZ and putative cAMP-binding protein CABP1
MNREIDNTIKFIRVGLNWNSTPDSSYDLDLSAFMLDEIGIARKEEDFVFYNHTVSDNDALVLSGDDRVGEVSGTNESIFVDLDAVPERISSLVFCVTIEASEDEHYFGETESAVLFAGGVADRFDKGEEPFCSVDLAKHSPMCSAMAVLQISRNGNGWAYDLILDSADFGITELCARYGLAVED